MGKQSILIIHKDDRVRRVIYNIISKFDFEIKFATNGLHGLQGIKFENPDLIVSAIDLPLLNGLEMAKMVKKDMKTTGIPIIFLHDELNLNLISKARKIGAKAFLIKPYLDNSLIYAIKRGLSRDILLAQMEEPQEPYEECLVPVS